MAETVVYVRATRTSIRKAILELPRAARSGSPAASAIMTRVGMTALGRIRIAFVVKARGGTDEAGLSWPALSPKTIAYSRRHPGLPKSKVRAASRPSWMLSAKQNDRWWQLYHQGLAIFKGNKGAAAKRAWGISKGEGAETILSKYGSTQVEILRDTGLLLNSLSPGVTSAEQIFMIRPGEVIVGTNRKWAAAHHNGIPGRLPQRRLWPSPNKWPASWWLDLTEQTRAGLLDLAILLIKGA